MSQDFKEAFRKAFGQVMFKAIAIKNFHPNYTNEQALEQAKNSVMSKPEFKNYDIKIDLSVVNGNMTTKKYGIHYYEYVKIRKIFEKMEKIHGYPMRPFEYIGYYSGVGFWIPDTWIVNKALTMYDWQYPSENSVGLLREVWIVYCGNELTNLIEHAIPTEIDSAAKELLLMDLMHEKLPLFENLGFYNTMNDIIINKNWDKILKRLNEWGY